MDSENERGITFVTAAPIDEIFFPWRPFGTRHGALTRDVMRDRYLIKGRTQRQMLASTRDIHFHLVVNPGARLSGHAYDWTSVLKDMNWWTEDPGPCHCGQTALYKWSGKGYCREHYAEAQAAAQTDSAALLGRYDRYRRYGKCGETGSHVTASLPKFALTEAIALADVPGAA